MADPTGNGRPQSPDPAKYIKIAASPVGQFTVSVAVPGFEAGTGLPRRLCIVVPPPDDHDAVPNFETTVSSSATCAGSKSDDGGGTTTELPLRQRRTVSIQCPTASRCHPRDGSSATDLETLWVMLTRRGRTNVEHRHHVPRIARAASPRISRMSLRLFWTRPVAMWPHRLTGSGRSRRSQCDSVQSCPGKWAAQARAAALMLSDEAARQKRGVEDPVATPAGSRPSFWVGCRPRLRAVRRTPRANSLGDSGLIPLGVLRIQFPRHGPGAGSHVPPRFGRAGSSAAKPLQHFD